MREQRIINKKEMMLIINIVDKNMNELKRKQLINTVMCRQEGKPLIFFTNNPIKTKNYDNVIVVTVNEN